MKKTKQMKRMTLDDWLGTVLIDELEDCLYRWQVIDESIADCFIARFSNEVDAFRFRLDYINRKMNP